MALVWRSWLPNENYAADGTADLERLINNLQALAAVLRDRFGYNVTIIPPLLDDHKTIPFADFMNRIEENVEAIRVFGGLPNWTPRKFWVPGVQLSSEDPNRWEHNGQLIEENVIRGQHNHRRCGRFKCGGR